jgi:hypothetical protein
MFEKIAVALKRHKTKYPGDGFLFDMGNCDGSKNWARPAAIARIFPQLIKLKWM